LSHVVLLSCVLLRLCQTTPQNGNRSPSNFIMRVAPIVRPVDPPVQAPVQAPVGDDEIARQLHEELHDGEEFTEDSQNHQIAVLRLMSAISADATKQVVRKLGPRRASRVKELVNICKVLYEAIITEGLMETEQTTSAIHQQMANSLVRVAEDLVQVTTRRVVRNGVRADEEEEIYGNLIGDAEYLRNNISAEE